MALTYAGTFAMGAAIPLAIAAVVPLTGLIPPPGFEPLAVDIIYLQTAPFEPGVGNCFEKNIFETVFSCTELPTDGC